MNAIARLGGWLGRHAIVYAALLAAMLIFAVWQSGDLQARWRGSEAFHQQQAAGLAQILSQTAARAGALEADLKRAPAGTAAALRAELHAAEQRRQILRVREPARWSSLIDKYTLDLDALRAEQERRLELAYLEREIPILQSALGRQESIEAQRAARRSCAEAKAALARHDALWLNRAVDALPGIDRRQPLARAETAACAAVDRWGVSIGRAEAELAKLGTVLPDLAADLNRRLAREQEQVGKSWEARAKRFWHRYGIDRLWRYALGALALIVVMPFAIRVLCYFVLAPLAMRRPAIVLALPGGDSAPVPVPVPVPPSEPSRTSVAVRLAAGEELLVRQDYLQTSSHAGVKDTRWLLDWRIPLTSLATGLAFLTRIRGHGEVTTVSAVRDPLAEVTILTLPQGAACVLQPRALAAVVQPADRPLRITRHWRLGSLHAWLTLQLRYFVFHGPVRLVVKGGRGVRVEPAANGRVLGQDQLVGFSTDLAYAIARSETFWPYFLGRAPLLKDRVLAGEGWLVIEEAPLSSRAGKSSRGIEGLIDAGMKAFGM